MIPLEQLRGNATSVIGYTGNAGQLVIDTDHWACRTMDGITPGGILIDGVRRNTQTGTTYTVVTADQGKVVTFNNAASVAVTLPQAGSSAGTFMPNQSGFLVINIGAGTVTITPTTSTINGAATLALANGDGARIISDGTNYLAIIGRNSSGVTPAGGTFAIQYNAGGGALAGVGALTAGQLVIGTSATTAPAAGTLTAGSGITVTNSSGTITITATGGAGVSGLYAPVMSTLPTSAGIGLTTWINQGTASVADTAIGITITQPSGNTGISARSKATAATPVSYTALVAFSPYPGNGTTNPTLYFGFYDGTKFEGIGFVNSGTGTNTTTLVVTRWTNTTTFSTNPFTWTDGPWATPLWLKIRDDGTNLIYSYSTDGVNFAILQTNTITTFLANANNIFLGGLAPPSANNYMSILSWTQGT